MFSYFERRSLLKWQLPNIMDFQSVDVFLGFSKCKNEDRNWIHNVMWIKKKDCFCTIKKLVKEAFFQKTKLLPKSWKWKCPKIFCMTFVSLANGLWFCRFRNKTPTMYNALKLLFMYLSFQLMKHYHRPSCWLLKKQY